MRSTASPKPRTATLLTISSASPRRARIRNGFASRLAVAGFTLDQLDVTIEENQLVIRGRQDEDKSRQYLHRGIAARQFQRTFVLAEGMEVFAPI